MPRLVCLSDTHLQHDFHVPDGDILVHAGDATFVGDEGEISTFVAWFSALPHRHKIFVAGNHDRGFEHEPLRYRQMVEDRGVIYLQDSAAVVEGLRFYGSPWQPAFSNWAFNLERGSKELAAKWAGIPDDVEVLVTHDPPWGILDRALDSGQAVGCAALRSRVEELPELKLHVFGHVHGGYGRLASNGTEYVNASVCDYRYRAVNAPHVTDL